MTTMRERYHLNLQQADVRPSLKSRTSSKDSRDSALSNCFDASMESVLLEATGSHLLPSSNIEEAQGWNPARHSTACCTGVAKRQEREIVRWSSSSSSSSLQRRNGVATVNCGIVDSSFRSEDSEILALWEEKAEQTGKLAVASDLGWQKPAGLHSPWRESVSNAVKKIESLSHAVTNNKEKLRTTWARSSPVHPKAGAVSVDSPRPSVDRKAGGRSPWRDFKMTSSSSPMKSTESVLHNSPKARYSHASPCRRMDRAEFEFESSPSSITAPKLFRQAVSCELQFASATVARSVDFNIRRKADEKYERSLWRDSNHHMGMQTNGNEFKLPCGQSPSLPELSPNLENMSKPAGGTGASETTTNFESPGMPARATSTNPSKLGDMDGASRTIAEAAERALSRQSTKLSLEAAESALSRQSTKVSIEAAERVLSRQCTKICLEAVSLSMERSMERCSSHFMDEAMLNEYASEAGGQQARARTFNSQEAGEQKASHRYYQRVTSRERSSRRSSRWGSSDGNHLDAIDFVAPSAARFLEDEGCSSPGFMTPIKTQGTVPFKWEKEPGKPKQESEFTTTHFHSALQLPPRLAVLQQKQCPLSQHPSLRNRYINMSMSAPLAELYTLPPSKSSSSEAQKVELLRPQPSFGKSAEEPCSTSLDRGPGLAMTKSRSVGEVRSALQNLSRLSVGGDQAIARKPCSVSGPPSRQFNQQKPAHLSSNIRPTSPTSILCGPDDGSRPSSNPSLSSECGVGLPISVPMASSLSPCSSPSPASFDSIEHDSEMMSPESSLTSPLRANTRCNSLSYDVSDRARQLGTERQEGAAHTVNNFVKFCKNGKRWMKTKTHSKLRTIDSPEVWAPSLAIQYQCDEIQDSVAQLENSTPGKSTLFGASRFLHTKPSKEEQRASPIPDFSARLGGKSSPQASISKIDHSNFQIDSRFAPFTSALPLEDLGNRSPTFAATLELLSPLQEFSCKNNVQMRNPSRTTKKPTRPIRLRVRVRTRFLVPIRRTLRNLFMRCTFRRHSKKVKAAAEPKLLYHVDYTLSPADFRFCKPN